MSELVSGRYLLQFLDPFILAGFLKVLLDMIPVVLLHLAAPDSLLHGALHVRCVCGNNLFPYGSCFANICSTVSSWLRHDAVYYFP